MIPLGIGLGPEWPAAQADPKKPTAPLETQARPSRLRATTGDEDAKLREAAQTFESLFVEILMQRMRSAQLDEGFFGDSPGASTYEGMFERFLSDGLAEGSPLGIADMLVRQWSGLDDPLAEADDGLARIERARAGRHYKDALPPETQVPTGPADE